MIELLGGIVEFAFDVVGMALSLVFDGVGLVFGLLGGLLSLVFTFGWIALAVGLVAVFIRRRKRAARQTAFVDDDGEEFVSYYHQEG